MTELISGFVSKDGLMFDIEIDCSGLQSLNHISVKVNTKNISHNVPRIEAHITSNDKMVNGNFIKGIFIDDIQGEPSNGYGTALMSSLIKFCKNNNIKFICGELCVDDLETHKDRLINFYKKFDFNIHISETGKSGSIKLELD